MSESAVRGPYKNGVAKRQRITAEAIEVFGEYGYTGGSLRKIAELVGVQASTIVALFGSKHGLLTAVLAHWDAVQIDDGDRHGLAFFETLRERMRYGQENPAWVEFFSTLSGEATSSTHPAHEFFATFYEDVTNHWERELRTAASRGEIKALPESTYRTEVRLLGAVMDGLQVQWLMNREVDMAGSFDVFLNDTINRWRSTR